MKLRAQNNQSKLAKAKRQIGIKLHNEYRFVDKQARLQLKKIEKEQEEVAAEIRKTHQTRIDNSNVYVGVLPHITKKPRVKPLPNDMEYIRELVARKHKKWKKREEITMVQLVATIRRKLDILIEPYLPADKGSSAAVTDHGAETKGECEGALKCNKKTHFVPPLPESYQLQPVSPKQKNLAMTNNEENQKPLSAERKKEERKLGKYL
ncbi:hypothetical protein EB796_001074 [Bugula neritina]|uniref:Uncharacterized protein n=1 Tax=Bugula neritina TaxID=10212 RepID=A0A7J7KR38_BUGNE|nr:hypothetical protein EB796_001074 [Bugula neritina]